MNERAPLPRVPERPAPGRVLVVAPHPDDDVIGCGGTAALHADLGDEVHALVLFDGMAGDSDRRWDPAAYAERRKAETLRGGQHLGYAHYTFWDYPEGHQPADAEVVAVARRFAGFVSELAPRTVYAPWIGEYHLDHHVAARVVRMGLELAGWDGQAWGYEVWTPLIPTLIHDVSGTFERKKQALAEHATQFEYHDMQHKALAITAQRSMYCRRGATHGEAFAPLGPPSPHDLALVEAVRRGEGPG